MTTFALAGLILVTLFVSWYLTGWMRRYALARGLLDMPNARSSHVVATPRAGGLAIVFAMLGSLAIAGVSGVVPWTPIVGAGGGILVAIIGFMDDRGHVRRRWRLLSHALAAAWVVWWIGGLPPLTLFRDPIDFGWVGHALAVVYVMWLINLTNFMDGLDGITGTEVVTGCLGGALLIRIFGPAPNAWLAPCLLAMATSGFAIWNWPPAKIFLGDSGSGFLGLMLAMLSLEAAWLSPDFFWSWNILLGVFVVDATVTLIRRTVRGERIYEPHRTHAYQHAAHRLGAHKPVTLAVAVINVLWLLPLALLVAANILDGLTGLLIAYAPLTGAALWLGAGRPYNIPAISC
jgi:Fuc2NAc and GlcNAc transferase